MKIYKVKFIYHKNLTENIIFENEKNLLENLGNNLTYINKLYTLFQSIVLNEEINIFIFSFILIIAYLLMSNGIFLAIPLLFIANLNDLLYGIIYALRLNIFQLLFVLLFMYLLVYLFTWFAFLYFSQLFEFSELYNIKLEGSIKKTGTTNVVPYESKELEKYYDCDIKNISHEDFEKLLGREIPNHDISFYKKKRIVIDYWTTVEYLRYSRGWTGRLFAWAIRLVIRLLRRFGNKATANTLIMGVLHEPMRGLSRMTGGAIHWEQLDGLITAFNGHTIKGFHKFFKEGRRIKKEEKLRKKAQKNQK